LTYEQQEQTAFCDWCDAIAFRRWTPELDRFPLFSIPNEGRMSGRTGKGRNRAGRRKGIPDLFIPIPRGERHGLFIEMKRSKENGGGRVSKEQHEWLDLLSDLGYCTMVCYGCDEAIEALTWYMEGNNGQ
jgi:hypothetical protein